MNLFFVRYASLRSRLSPHTFISVARRLILFAVLVLVLGILSTPATGSAAGLVTGAAPAVGPAALPPAQAPTTYCASGTVYTDYDLSGTRNNGEDGVGREAFQIDVSFFTFPGGYVACGSACRAFTNSNGFWFICNLPNASW